MIKVEVTKNSISIQGHANYADYGKDIVCSAVSSVVTTTVEGIAIIDENAITINGTNDKMIITNNKQDDITNKLLINMLNLLHELEKEYPKNIKIINKEE